MLSCVYYGLEDVSTKDIVRACAAADAPKAFIAQDAIWPAETAHPRPESVPDRRELSYQDELMAWISRLFELLSKAENAASFIDRRGVSLLEVARYQIHSEIAIAEQRWRALCEIIRRAAPDRLIWVAPRDDLPRLHGLQSASPGLELKFISAAGTTAPRSRIVAAAKTVARPIVQVWRRARASWLTDQLRLPVSATGRDVVFTEFFPNNIEALVPVDELLRSEYNLRPIWLVGRQSVKRALARRGIKGLVIKDLEFYSLDRALGRDARRQLFHAIDALPDEAFEGTGGVAGRAFLAPAIKECLADRLAEAARCVEAFDTALRHLGNMSVVSASYTSPVGRASALVARQLGCRSIFVQHGFIIPNAFACGFCSDRLLLWGQYDVRNQLRAGIDRERIGVTGATIYDELIKRRKPAMATSDAAVEGTTVALLASRTGGTFVSYPAAERCLVAVVQAVRRVTGAKLVIKPHPSDRTPLIDDVARRFAGTEIARSENSQSVIERSQVVIVMSSTTGLEACVAQKPLIVLQIGATTHFLPYGDYDAALMIPAEEQDLTDKIAEAIGSIQSDGALRERLAVERRRLLDDMLEGARGDAAERVAAEIHEQLMGPPELPVQAAARPKIKLGMSD